VGDFMDGEEQVLVGSGPEDVGNGPVLEREEGCVAEVVCEGDLESDDTGDDVLCQGFMAAELGDLGDCQPPAAQDID
jgi:hypothetical protein